MNLWVAAVIAVYFDRPGDSLNGRSGMYTAAGSGHKERAAAAVVVLFRFIHPEERWSVLLCARISSPPSQRRRKQRRPRSCRPWLQSLGCTGAPGVTGLLLLGIQLAKRRRSPVFNNNHLKSLQLARSYKEMESRKMWRGEEGGRKGYELRFSEPFECQLLFHMENSRGALCSSIISHES